MGTIIDRGGERVGGEPRAAPSPTERAMLFTMIRATPIAALLAACTRVASPDGGSSPDVTAPAASSTTTTPMKKTTTTTVRGRIEAIRLHDISKARGHHTYNVELVVRGKIEGTWPFASPHPEVVNIRVAKIYFDDLDRATRDALAPDGPKPELQPPRFEQWTTGDEVTLPVEMTSPELGHAR